MKTATSIYDTVNKSCESTPFREIDFAGLATIKLFYTLRAGQMGFQVHAIIHNFQGNPDMTGNNIVTHSKSGGYGYCKESEQYWCALRSLGIMTKQDKDSGHGSSVISHKYHKGGNFYYVPKSEILKYK